MIFTIELDGERVSCSSAGCVHRLMLQGWQLSDPRQADALERHLVAEREAEASSPDQSR